TGPSTFTGILGPSGAGKSSLLDILAGRRKGAGCGWGASGHVVTGELRVNGEVAEGEGVRKISGYVTQEDILPPTLTCKEHLMFHALLRMGRAKKKEREGRVLELLEELGLSGVQRSLIGGGLRRGISGGEKRRLSIATELLNRPALIFLDEPTTGLDASTALRVAHILARLALGGTTVVASLHQPRREVLFLIDQVMLLSRGQVAYFGSPWDAEKHFASIGNPFP
ncbi:unnamed protein product, partial [Discosporangium mesarthrocarpum]